MVDRRLGDLVVEDALHLVQRASRFFVSSSLACRRKMSSTSGKEPKAKAPFLVTNDSSRVAALPETPLMVSTTPRSFFPATRS